MIGKELSHYRITGKLGEGGMGEVYEAEDLKLHRQVALKVLPSELYSDANARKRLLREAHLASRLNHPNIATIFEVDEADGLPFIAMEIIEGESLKDILTRDVLSLNQLGNIGRQISAGLKAAHDGGVLHRDLKPGNIMVGSDGHTKVLDFGLAVMTETERGADEATQQFITRTASQFNTSGTAPYMAPETLRGEKPDVRTDIFSLGVLFYECITGRLPFHGDTAFEVLHNIVHTPAIPVRSHIPDIPVAWERFFEIILRAALLIR